MRRIGVAYLIGGIVYLGFAFVQDMARSIQAVIVEKLKNRFAVNVFKTFFQPIFIEAYLQRKLFQRGRIGNAVDENALGLADAFYIFLVIQKGALLHILTLFAVEIERKDFVHLGLLEYRPGRTADIILKKLIDHYPQSGVQRTVSVKLLVDILRIQKSDFFGLRHKEPVQVFHRNVEEQELALRLHFYFQRQRLQRIVEKK